MNNRARQVLSEWTRLDQNDPRLEALEVVLRMRGVYDETVTGDHGAPADQARLRREVLELDHVTGPVRGDLDEAWRFVRLATEEKAAVEARLHGTAREGGPVEAALHRRHAAALRTLAVAWRRVGRATASAPARVSAHLQAEQCDRMAGRDDDAVAGLEVLAPSIPAMRRGDDA